MAEQNIQRNKQSQRVVMYNKKQLPVGATSHTQHQWESNLMNDHDGVGGGGW